MFCYWFGDVGFADSVLVRSKIDFLVKLQLMKSGRKSQINVLTKLASLTPRDKIAARLNDFQPDKSKSPTNGKSNQGSPSFCKTARASISAQSRSKEKSKNKHKIAYKNKQNKTQQERRQQKLSEKRVQHLLKHLFQKHQQIKNNLQKLRKQKEAREQQQLQQCTFTPEITKSPRFRAQDTFLQRQKFKMQQRQSQILQRKYEISQQESKQCSFHPNLESKKRSLDILTKGQTKKREKEQEIFKAQEIELIQQLGGETKAQSKTKVEKKRSPINWQAIRNAVKRELQNIEL